MQPALQKTPQSVSGFYKHNHIASNTRAVTHSSALFLILNDSSVRTELHFLNYWCLKRGVSDVTCQCELRTMSGSLLESQEFPVATLKSYCLRLEEVFAALPQEPSVVEIHFRSGQNLFIPYPAIMVRYVGPDWHTGMHSTARYFYEDSADLPEKITQVQQAEESNISLFPDPGISTSLVVHNGTHRTVSAPAMVTVVNAHGESRSATIPELVLAPYETRLITIDDLMHYKQFLNETRGMATLAYATHGVFPRVMVLHRHSSGHYSVEHSNFGESMSQNDICEVQEPQHKLIYSLPIPKGNITADIDIYPTYPIQAAPYQIVQQEISPAGDVRHRSDALLAKGMFLQQTYPSGSETRYVEIDYEHPEHLPNRFHTALHYTLPESKLPAIILDGPMPWHASPVGTRWMPYWCDAQHETRFFICHRSFGDDVDDASVDLHITLIGSREGERLECNRTLNTKESLELSVKELLKDTNWAGEYGWAYIKFAPSSYHTVYFLSIRNGCSIMAGHAF